MTSQSEYLLAIYIEENRSAPPVSFERLATTLDRSSAAVTEMCQRLDGEGLIEHRPYEGVSLTEEGREIAERHHERYVILSWFFRSILDLEDHERRAMKMADAVSPEVAVSLAATLPHVDSRETTTDSSSEEEAGTQ